MLLNKILPVFVLPLGVGLILLIWGIARRRRIPTLVAAVVLWASCNPIVGAHLIRAAEQWAERRPVAEVVVADAIVVLSASRGVPPGHSGTTEWGDANRFFGGLELMLAHRAPLLVFTGAEIAPDPDLPFKGVVLAGYARANGVPAERIAVTERVQNTADEAVAVARLLRERSVMTPRIVLVTSAFHMPRARQLFEQEGMTVDPFPVHFWTSVDGGSTLLALLPSATALMQTQTAVREFYGRAFYWLKAQF